MNIHKNARTTPRSRGQIVERVLTQQERPPAVAAAVGVSDRTVRKWLARYAAEAAAGLADRSCRPRRSPRATPPLLVSWVEHLRRQRWAGAEIAQALQLSASTVARLLRRQGLARLRQLEPPVPVQRYEWAQPGDLLHLDVKKLGRIARVGLPPRLFHVAPPHRGAARLAVLLQLGAPAWRAPRSSAHHLLGGPEQSRGSSNLAPGRAGGARRRR